MKSLRKFFVVLLSSVTALSFVACDHSGSDSKPAGPAGPASFTGVTMNLNPTVAFTSALDFTYVNNVVADSVFPVTDADPINGVFTYSASSDYSSGVLTLNFVGENPGDDAPFEALEITLRDFVAVDGNIIGATGVFDGNSYQIDFSGNFPQAVTAEEDDVDEFDALPTYFFEGNVGIDYYFGYFTPEDAPDDFTYTKGELGVFTFDRHSRLYTDRGRFNPPVISETNPGDYVFTSSTVTDHVIIIRIHSTGMISYIGAYSPDLTTEYGYFPGNMPE